MKLTWKNKKIIIFLALLVILATSCILAGISFHLSSVNIKFPEFRGAEFDPGSDSIRVISAHLGEFSSQLKNLFDQYSEITVGIIATLFLITILSIISVLFTLYFWSMDRKKMEYWEEIGIAINKLEFLQGSRIKLNQTEIILNKSQYSTMKKLVESRLNNEALHSVEIGDNATQAVKRLREELGSKLIEKTLIMNHRGKGYWIDVDPKRVKGIDISSEKQAK